MTKSFWDEEKVIAVVTKNKSENIDVKHCKKNEKSYIDIRVSKVDKENVFHPTSSGVAIPLDSWKEILEKIQEFKID